MRDLAELNINEGGRPVTRAPPTKQQIREFESLFAVELPEDYLVLLQHSNGGHPEVDSFQLPGPEEGALLGVNRFYHLGDDKNDHEGLWRAATAWEGRTSSRMVPFANDPGGNQLMFDFGCQPPAVKLCIHDEDFRIVHLADSFGEFIDGLVEDPDMV